MVALVAVVLVLALWPRSVDRPTPRLPVASIPATRPAPPPEPPTALEIVDRAAVELRYEQMIRLRALDRIWEGEERELNGAIRAAERELSVFMRKRSRCGTDGSASGLSARRVTRSGGIDEDG